LLDTNFGAIFCFISYLFVLLTSIDLLYIFFNLEINSEAKWQKVGDFVDVRAASRSESELEISSRKSSTSPLKSILTRSRSPRKLNEIDLSNHNVSNKNTSIHSTIAVQTTLQKSALPISPSKKTPLKENINSIQSPIKLNQLDFNQLPQSNKASTNSSIVTYKTPLKKVISSYYESCESRNEKSESPSSSSKNQSQTIHLNLSESTNCKERKSISPQHKDSESIKEYQDSDIEFSTSNQSENKKPETESAESILIEHTESDEISHNNLLNEEKNQTPREKMLHSANVDTSFELREEIAVTIASKNVSNKKIEDKPMDESANFYAIFDNLFKEERATSETDGMDVNEEIQKCSKLMHEWVLGSFEF
jgi:hypothetical protein